MADDYSFDVVSKVDMNLVAESLSVALKEIANRYDFRGSNANVELDIKTSELKLTASDEFKIKSLYDVVLTRFSKRGIPLRNMEPKVIESALGGTAKQVVKIKQGIPTDKAKEMVRMIKDAKLKVTASIQSDQLRVTSRSKDELQSAMTLLRGNDFGQDLQFTNYR